MRNYDQTLRCAVPVDEALNSRHALPPMPEQVTLIAADGSQIFADRHAEVEYCLVNTGAICDAVRIARSTRDEHPEPADLRRGIGRHVG